MIKTSRISPILELDEEYRYESFDNNKSFSNKKNGRLPAMGWNSWNAFGSQNTEELSKIMADRLVELGLDKLGYKYVVLDDGCYYPERIDERLQNEAIKFPSGFRALADYIHSKGLKFGMYNDIGTNLCAGSSVGTCGYEDVDAISYVNWGVDFLKVDNCYYLWDNATFSNAENAKYTYAPKIKSIRVTANDFDRTYPASEGIIVGDGARHVDGFVTGIGTFDGTNVGRTPVGAQSSELQFELVVPVSGEYKLIIEYASAKEVGIGQWLQISVGLGEKAIRYYDNMLVETKSADDFVYSEAINISLQEGVNVLRLMNHRRQENVLASYAAMFNALQEAAENNDIVLSICEWGKTQPQNWGYKIGNSWRILNDITFQVGSPNEAGTASWTDAGTASITSQYDKAVIMDEFAGLLKGWNDPDMLVIGMKGISNVMARSHMTMWCMMNSPLMLGMDLRSVEIGDEIYNIISNEEVIALNQDPLGVQAKRVYSSLEEDRPDKVYITNHDRVDVLAKALGNGDIAVSFFNLSDRSIDKCEISIDRIISFIGSQMSRRKDFENAMVINSKDLWTKEESNITDGIIRIESLDAYVSYTVRLSL